MIIEMNKEEFDTEFFDEFAALECGDHFKPENQQHIDWAPYFSIPLGYTLKMK